MTAWCWGRWITMVIGIPAHIMNVCMYCDLDKNGVSKMLWSLSCRQKKWESEGLSSWLKVKRLEWELGLRGLSDSKIWALLTNNHIKLPIPCGEEQPSFWWITRRRKVSHSLLCELPDGTTKGTKSVFDLNSQDLLCVGNRVTLCASHPFLEWPGHRDSCEMEGYKKSQAEDVCRQTLIFTTPGALAQRLPWPGCQGGEFQVINPCKGTERLLHPDKWETQISSAHFHPF